MEISVIIADDHAIVREGVKALLNKVDSSIKVLGEASNGNEVLDIVKEARVDVCILDISMPLLNGFETIARLSKISPNTKVIVLSMHDDRASVKKALKVGAKGYLLKDNAIEEIVKAIHDVNHELFYLSSKISNYIVEEFVCERHDDIKAESIIELTGKEREILQLIAEGYTSKEIASQLDMSHHTVNVHRNNIMQKLGLHKLTELVKYAILKKGLLRYKGIFFI
jgi:DNA-binding NarL/FixJ family response regulator